RARPRRGRARQGRACSDAARLGGAARAALAAVIGAAAEALVYRYGSCDRSTVYPNLGGPAPVRFADRFTGTADEPGLGELRNFVELTAANELDVLAHNEELMRRYGASLLDLF